jgi:hypothetical protein
MKYDLVVRRAIGDFRRLCFAGIMKCFGCLHERLAATKPDETRVGFKKMKVLDWVPLAEKVDLVLKNFFLDCFRASQLEWLIPQLADTANRDNGCLLAEFREPESGWRNIL